MRKLFFFIVLFCCLAPQLRADKIQSSTTFYSPEYVYTMQNGNGWSVDKDTHSTKDEKNVAHFAFYQASDATGNAIENAYYIFCVESQKWLTYPKANGYNNCRNFVQMSATFTLDDYFYFNDRGTETYDIAPYNNSGVAAKYLNWYEGADQEHTTIGLWQQNSTDDPGSKFTIKQDYLGTEPSTIYTISTARGSWMVTEGDDNKLYGTKEKSNGKVDVFDATNPYHQFMFVKKANNTYLYNVGAGKYVKNDETTESEPTEPISFVNTSGTVIDQSEISNGNFCIMFDNSHFINLGGSHQITIDGWGPGGTISGGCVDDGNRLTIQKVGTFYPQVPDNSELLEDGYFNGDCSGVKIDAYNGTLNEENYGYYHKWESGKTAKVWTHEGSVSTSTEVPMVTAETFSYASKDTGYKFELPENKNLTEFYVTNYLTGITLTAGGDYKIVGYSFIYTTTTALTDDNSYEGEITCSAPGTYIVDVKNLNSKSVDIAFGQGKSSKITLSAFYVFVQRGKELTVERLASIQDEENTNTSFYYIYTIASKRNQQNYLYAPSDSDKLDICGNGCSKHGNIKVDSNDENQQFMLLPFSIIGNSKQTDKYKDCFFLYNVGQGKFVSKEGSYTLLTEYPRNAVEIIASEGEYEGYFRINFNKTNLLNVSTGHCATGESCVVTNWNSVDPGNNFYIKEVRDLREETDNDLSFTIMGDAYNVQSDAVRTEIANLIQAELDKSGVGYPAEGSNDRKNLLTIKDDISEGVTTSYFDMPIYLDAFKKTTDVQMPETGKAYRIKTIINYGTNDPRERYLKGTADGHLTLANSTDAMADNSSIFVAKSMDEAADGQGTFAFVNDNGQFLVGARTNTNGFTEDYEQDNNNANLKLTTTANKDYFGGFLLKTTESNNTYNLQLGQSTESTDLVIKYDDKNPNAIFADASGSSIFYLEEASYPNVVNLREPAVADGKAYSSIWLPFSVEIPEGVRAYKAHVDYTTNQLVCGEVKNILPGGQGAILISEKAQEIVLAPATADVAPLQDNDLKGTNVTLARNQNVTTFVLNGSKGEIGFYPYTGTNIAKYKAYVEVDKAQAAQGLRFSFGTATDIENTLTEGEGEAKEYYDLSGRRVAQPTKGLYIVNGKKMYIK